MGEAPGLPPPEMPSRPMPHPHHALPTCPHLPLSTSASGNVAPTELETDPAHPQEGHAVQRTRGWPVGPEQDTPRLGRGFVLGPSAESGSEHLRPGGLAWASQLLLRPCLCGCWETRL